MKIYLVRHAQTYANAENVIDARKLNSPLTEHGQKQALELALSLQNEFDALFSSPLKRAVETANIISNHLDLKPILLHDDLQEVNCGSIDGTARKILWEQNPDFYDKWKNNLEIDYSIFGGESVEQIRSRIKKFLEEMKKTGYQKVLAVSHQRLIKFTYAMLAPEKFKQTANASIHEFEI